MSVLFIVKLKCTRVASHADPWWVRQTEGQTEEARPLYYAFR